MKKTHINKRQLSIKNLALLIGLSRSEFIDTGKLNKKLHNRDRRNLRKVGMDYYERLEEDEK